MPGRNKTGPLGNGPMTGRGFGVCNSNNAMNAFCMGNRRSRGRGYYANGYGMNTSALNMTPEEKKEMLDIRKEYLKKELENIDGQLENM